MRIKKVRVQGFRLLRDVELMLEDTATVVVGRNNSGKTSLTDVFRCFGSGGSSFRLQDFSAADRTKFAAARKARLAGAAPQDVLAMLPTIAITITMSYDKAAPDIGPMSSFMIDLDANSDIAIAHVIYAPRLSALSSLLDFEADAEASEPKVEFYRHIKEILGSAYEIEVWALDPTTPSNRRRLNVNHLNALMKWDLVRAQRTLDHSGHGDADVIGSLLGSGLIANK